MATVSSGILGGANFVDLKPIDSSELREDVYRLLVPGEEILSAFKTIRDQVVFTTKRVVVVNVQGIVGKKVAYCSYPYSKVQYYAVETAGVLDIDSELVLAFSDGNRLQFDFRASVDIRKLNAAISAAIL